MEVKLVIIRKDMYIMFVYFHSQLCPIIMWRYISFFVKFVWWGRFISSLCLNKISSRHLQHPPLELALDGSTGALDDYEVEEGGDGIWSVVGGKVWFFIMLFIWTNFYKYQGWGVRGVLLNVCVSCFQNKVFLCVGILSTQFCPGCCSAWCSREIST
mgnify:CR=1 FL=1